MGDLSLAQLLAALGTSGIVGVIGLILSGRTGRQRDFDARVDKTVVTLTAERDTARARVQALEEENDKLRIRNTRYQVLLWSHGIDPESQPQGAST